jgi:putative phosphoesterase
MRIGLISDIHANLAALEAVLDALCDADQILCAGDIVGYYDQPNEVCSRLREIGAPTIRGNHDAYVTGALQPDPVRSLQYQNAWTRSVLTPENLAWLESLPVQRDLRFEEATVTLRHASPWDELTYLYPDSPRLNDLELRQDQILVMGHTHYPLAREIGGGMLINPGSVGQPRDRDPRASCALLKLPGRNVSLRRVDYDFVAVQERLRQRGWDPGMVAILSRTT